MSTSHGHRLEGTARLRPLSWWQGHLALVRPLPRQAVAARTALLAAIAGAGATAVVLGWSAAAIALAATWGLLAGTRGKPLATALLARRNAALERELRATAAALRASRARIFAAGAHERRRIERDLHDRGQNRIVALRIKLQLAAEVAGEHRDEQLHATLVELGDEAQEALDALRAIAHGIYPPLLATAGLEAALAAELPGAALPVALRVRGRLPRSTPDAEAAVYHCCLEALQNASKHAGPGAHATLSLSCVDGMLRFAVDDDGPGWAPACGRSRGGLTHMRDRVAAVGGTVVFDRSPRGGARVRGCAPWPSRERPQR